MKRYNEIKSSLSFYTYKEHSLSLKMAADDLLEKAILLNKVRVDDSQRIHVLGLFRGCMLLYGVSLELILKARGLYEERDNILSGNIKSYRDFMRKWQPRKGDGHGYFDIIEFYKLSISKSENELLSNYQDYTRWAGRFPFPNDFNKTEMMEREGRYSGKVNAKHKVEIQLFIDNQIEQMKL
ncbi:MAG: hypothetical protein ABJO28_08045 [Maribacter dokdonensis]|uniref:hypothetical protein n=1 Tax=Maribacter dokdonensis TaxID=320912 RepID=UPI003265C2B6